MYFMFTSISISSGFSTSLQQEVQNLTILTITASKEDMLENLHFIFVTYKSSLTCIKLFYSFISEHLSYFNSFLGFHCSLVVELVGQKSCPVYVILKLQAWIANITCMESLFHGKLQ